MDSKLESKPVSFGGFPLLILFSWNYIDSTILFYSFDLTLFLIFQ